MPEHSSRPVAPVTVAVLAAGASTRMGTPKQLALVGGESLLHRAVDAALATNAVSTIVVIGAGADAMMRELRGRPVRPVLNGAWTQGLSSSIRCAVAALESTVDGVLFTTCDQPKVSGVLLQGIIDRFTAARDAIVASAYAGTLGIPALFPRRSFSALCSLSGDAGAKSLILQSAGNVISVPFPEGSFDIDSIPDLQASQR